MKNEKQCIIYKITNLINNKIYVGQDINNNPKYYGKGTIIILAIKKYGKNNFKKEILEYCDYKELDDKEKYWIKKLKSQDKQIGYNILDGGQNRKNIRLPEKTKEKISLSLKKYYVENPEVCKEISNRAKINNKGDKNPMFGKGYKIKGTKNGMYGKTHTDETKDKIRQIRTGRKHKTETIENYKINNKGDKNPMFGKNQYDIWLKKYGKEIADYKHKQWKLKISKATKGRKHKNETKQIISNSKIGTKCINNGEINKYIKNDKLDKYFADGWKLGMLKK